MVLKTGPDRPVQPVQPETGVSSGPVLLKNRKSKKNDQKPETAGSTVKTANRHG
jgi:class 3 adenylate cyclase